MANRKKILIIDDETQILKMLRLPLEAEGFQIETAENGTDGLLKIPQYNPDLVILDLSLPDIDGLEVLKKMREWSKIPVIVLTARHMDDEKVKLLDAGADDYMTKPFSVKELLARVRVTFRHVRESERSVTLFSSDYLKIDYEKRLVLAGDMEVHLTPIEYKILLLFTHSPGKVITSHHIMRTIWGPGMENETGHLRFYILQLRRKIEPDPQKPKLLVTVPGVGYRLIVF